MLTNVERLIVVQKDDKAGSLSCDCLAHAKRPTPLPFEDAVEEGVKSLILGWNRRGPKILEEFSAYVPRGSSLLIVAPANSGVEISHLCAQCKDFVVEYREGDPHARKTLELLDLANIRHVIVLGDVNQTDRHQADTASLITLLHLRDLAEVTGAQFTTVNEMLDIHNRDLADDEHADDFVVSDHLISLMLAQVSVNPHVGAITDELLVPEGCEIYMRRPCEFGLTGEAIDWSTIIETGFARNETVIGYRQRSRERPRSRDGDQELSDIILNPSHKFKVTLNADDSVIVLAQSHRRVALSADPSPAAAR